MLSLALVGCDQPTAVRPGPLRADVTPGAPAFFTDRAAFAAQFPGLPMEDFETGRVAAGAAVSCPGPVDAFSADKCFSPGEIESGVQFNSDHPEGGEEIVLVGPGFFGAPSKNIVAGIFTDAFLIDFSGGDVTAVGMDLVAYLSDDQCQIDVFGQSGLLLSTTAPGTGGGTFWGVSTGEPITRIRITSPTGQAEGVDNISFGRGARQSPPVADAGGPYSGAEGGAVLFDGSLSADPGGSPLTYAWNFGDGATGEGATPSHTYADNGGYTVTLTVTASGSGLQGTAATTATIANVAPTVGAITAPIDPVEVGMAVTAGASFTDPGTLDIHTGMIDWGDGSTSSAAITESDGSGSASGNHAYSAAGVYTVTLAVTDKDGGSGQSAFQFVVVFNPEAGFVTGGGWINSPAGAYAGDPRLSGKATFGFVSRYPKGATTPNGNTEFDFHVGSLHFQTTSYDWLVVSGSKVRFKGSGTINGAGDFAFLVSAVDGDVTGGDPDTFRMKIWDKTTGAVIYDSEMGRGDGAPAITVLGGGSIVIHN